MNPSKFNIYQEALLNSAALSTRRLFLKQCGMGLGAAALGQLLGSCAPGGTTNPGVLYDPNNPMMPRSPHFPGKAKSVIYLHMAGAPSQLEMFDGAQLVGPIPTEIQNYTVYAGALSPAPRDAAATQALLTALKSEAAREAMKKLGLEAQ